MNAPNDPEPRTVAQEPAVTGHGGHLSADELRALRDASLSTQQGIRLASHVAVCADCHQALIEARSRSRPPARPAPAETPVVPGHRVEDWIGGGGFGEVWRGRHERLWQDRAFKVLKTGHLDAAAREQMLREPRMMANLPVHPNRVQVHDLVEHADSAVVVMDYVAGGPLSRRAPLGWQQAVRYLIHACEGLLELHQRKMVHRDIKPANLLWDPGRDAAVLADYGLASFLAERAALAGTAGYLAPELIDEPASTRADVFALACTLHALLTGAPPFATGDPYSGLLEAKHGLPAGALAALPAGVRDVIRLGVEPDPVRRPDLPEFLARLRTAHIVELAQTLQNRLQAARGTARLTVTVSVAHDEHADYETRLQISSDEKSGRVEVPPGHLVEFATDSDQVGHLTMLNFDTAGSLDVLVPGVISATTRIEPGRKHRVQVQLTPSPAGDRAVIIWTPAPLPASAEAWRQRLAGGSGPVTRGMTLLGHWIDEAAWSAVQIDVVPPGV